MTENNLEEKPLRRSKNGRKLQKTPVLAGLRRVKNKIRKPSRKDKAVSKKTKLCHYRSDRCDHFSFLFYAFCQFLS